MSFLDNCFLVFGLFNFIMVEVLAAAGYLLVVVNCLTRCSPGVVNNFSELPR